jgi:TonB family protein
VEAKLLRSVTPEYSLEATHSGIEGLVILVISIDSHGRVRDARVVQGLGHGLDEAAVRAAKQTVWQPASLGGVPVPTERRFSVRFNLRS